MNREQKENDLIDHYKKRDPEHIKHHISCIKVLSDKQLDDIHTLIIKDEWPENLKQYD